MFRSDNMSTISVIKEVLSKETTKRNIPVRITHGIQDLVSRQHSRVEVFGSPVIVQTRNTGSSALLGVLQSFLCVLQRH